MPLRPRSLLVGITAAALTVTLAPAPASAAPARASLAAVTSDRTSAVEARRVDRVPTPKLDWYSCYGYAECATVRVPLDYDHPTGEKAELAVLRVKARNQKNKIGSLFVNPGGPGGQGVEMAYYAPEFLGNSVLDQFDVVGFDPRGIGFSDQVKCFRSNKEQSKVAPGLNVAFPYTKAEEKAYVASSKALGKACSTTGKRLAGAMSTAEAARDMEVLRRAVGDKKLSYLGFSYGTALGQYYANMFPDRVRAIVNDGVINPISWTGTAKTRDMILDDRLRSADGAYKALREILVRCDKAGGVKCVFAGGNPVANYDLIARRLRSKPLVDGTFRFTYADFVVTSLSMLYSPDGYEGIVSMAQDLLILTEPPAKSADAKRRGAAKSLSRRLDSLRAAQPARAFPYDNSLEAFLGVTCTDGQHPKDAAAWPALTARADKRAPYFGRAWAWSSAPCARGSWTVRDEDAYTGPFNRRTSSPVLFVGNHYDPATNYNEAVSSSKLMPNSRLISSNSWGHTAYGTSACVNRAVDAYLVKLTLPRAGTVCTGDIQPFTGVPSGTVAATTRAGLPKGLTARTQPAKDAPKKLPPVSARIPLVR